MASAKPGKPNKRRKPGPSPRRRRVAAATPGQRAAKARVKQALATHGTSFIGSIHPPMCSR
jgi:hypothetical protein